MKREQDIELIILAKGKHRVRWFPKTQRSAVFYARRAAKAGSIATVRKSGVVVWTNDRNAMQ